MKSINIFVIVSSFQLLFSCSNYNRITLLPAEVEQSKKLERLLEYKELYIEINDSVIVLLEPEINQGNIHSSNIEIASELPKLPTVFFKYDTLTYKAIVKLNNDSTFYYKNSNEIVILKSDIKNITLMQKEKWSTIEIVLVILGSVIGASVIALLLYIKYGNWSYTMHWN